MTPRASRRTKVAKRLRLKGALHTHTLASDGSLEPSELAAFYRRLGYDFVFLTDHNKVTHAGGMKDFLVLPGMEVGASTKEPDQYWHFVGLCPEEATSPEKASVAALYRFLRTSTPFCFLAHPYWSQLSGKDLLRFEGLACVEVWNTGCELEIARGCSSYAWDWALSAGARLSAVAVDDCHGYDDVGKAWVTVEAKAFTADAILDALSAGAFTSSCGPEILSLRRRGKSIRVTTSPCRSIAFIADRQKGKHVVAGVAGVAHPPPGEAVSSSAKPVAASLLTSASYTLAGVERYVRVECTDAEGRKAWSNPLYMNRNDQ